MSKKAKIAELTNIAIITGKLQMIQASEINYQISCFYDCGFTVKIGDEVNGFVYVSGLCETFLEAAEHLIEQVLIHYPASDFAEIIALG